MASSRLSLTFRIFKNDQLVREEILAQSVIKVGKVPSAHLRIDDETVSRMHAIVEVTNDEVHIIDLGSTRVSPSTIESPVWSWALLTFWPLMNVPRDEPRSMM